MNPYAVRVGSRRAARQAAGQLAGPVAPQLVTTRLEDTAAVTLDPTGAGTVTLPHAGAVPPGELWEVERVTVMIAGGLTGNPNATLVMYRGSAINQHALDGTNQGGEDTSELPNPILLNPGDFLTFVWAAGTAGAEARATIQGIYRRL